MNSFIKILYFTWFIIEINYFTELFNKLDIIKIIKVKKNDSDLNKIKTVR